MAAEKLFWQDPYRTESSARVTSVNQEVITLDRTIFYASSGGQDSDSGTIGGYPVARAKKEGLEIYYTIEGPHALKQGDETVVAIDWERRYRLMRLHFAAEIVLELVYRHFDHPLKIGANIHQDKARIDFAWDGNISRIFPLIEQEAGRLIEADLPIRSEFSHKEQERRYWEIDGFAKVSCGGTHLGSTGEVGAITLRRKNIGKDKERIEISLAGE